MARVFFFRSMLKSRRKHAWLQANVLGTYFCVCVLCVCVPTVCVFIGFVCLCVRVCVWTWRQIGNWFLPHRSWFDRDYFNPTVVTIISIDYSWTWRCTDLAQSPHIHWTLSLSLYFSLSLVFLNNTENMLRQE